MNLYDRVSSNYYTAPSVSVPRPRKPELSKMIKGLNDPELVRKAVVEFENLMKKYESDNLEYQNAVEKRRLIQIEFDKVYEQDFVDNFDLNSASPEAVNNFKSVFSCLKGYLSHVDAIQLLEEIEQYIKRD